MKVPGWRLLTHVRRRRVGFATLALYGVCGALLAGDAEPAPHEFAGREHPFMAPGSGTNPADDDLEGDSLPWASETQLLIQELLLVGTLGEQGRYQALIRFADGVVRHLGVGDRLLPGEAVVLEVTRDSVDIESDDVIWSLFLVDVVSDHSVVGEMEHHVFVE